MSINLEPESTLHCITASLVVHQTHEGAAVLGARMAMSSEGMERNIPLSMEHRPLPPKPYEGFEFFVAGKLTELVEKLDQLDLYSRTSNADLDRNLPNVLRGVLNDELKQISPAHQISSQKGEPQSRPIVPVDHAREKMEQLTNQKSLLEKELNQYKARMRSQTSLERELNEYKVKVRDLSLDFSKKNQEAKKLHEIIHQSANDDDEVPDEEITKQFSDLRYLILKVVSKHFSNVEGKIYTKDLATLTKEEKVLSMRAGIAAKLYRRFFQPKAMLFGMTDGLDADQRELESRLIEANVPHCEVDEWRVRTVKVARLASMKGRLNPAVDAADDLCDAYKDFAAAKDRAGMDEARGDMRDLCIKAFELALTLRCSRSMFVWGQGEAPSQMPLSAVEVIKDFNMKVRTPQPKPVRILFGPVWKIVDSDRILLRNGEMLFGGGPEK